MPTQEPLPVFEAVVEQHKGILFNVARTYCPHEADRQDLIQEILVQLWTSYARYNSQYNITTWIYRVSINVAVSFYRKNRSRRSSHVSLDEQVAQLQGEETHHQQNKEEQLKQLTTFLHELRELDKSLMFLYLEQKTYSEMADILGISVTNVATRINRIKATLKQKFLTTENL